MVNVTSSQMILQVLESTSDIPLVNKVNYYVMGTQLGYPTYQQGELI